MGGGDYVVTSGFCYQLHKAKPQRFDCFGSFVNMIKGAVCMAMFVYILAKMNINHRRALAGYTKNTINIDVHMTMMIFVGYWTISWGALNIFNVSNTDGGDNLRREEVNLFAVAHGICHAISSFVELIILLLLCTSSIGKNNFYRSWFVASFWAFATFLTSLFVILFSSGEQPIYWLSRNLEIMILTRSILTVLMNLSALIFYYSSGSDRSAVIRYSKYLVGIYSLIAVSIGLELTNNFISVNIGICSLDIAELIHFCSFAPITYLTLKRDCQYWCTDVDDEEEMLLNHANEMITWSELPNYKDVVIPKTELYYRSKIMEQVDVSVEIHLWRRKLAVVKRFKFDLLTRDNIKFFKAEANIFQRLKHENIVDFYGVLVDPPSLGIVMQFCSHGDVFKILEKERNNLEKVKEAEDEANRRGAMVEAGTGRGRDDKASDEDGDVKWNSKATGRSSLLVTDLHVIKSVGRTSSDDSGGGGGGEIEAGDSRSNRIYSLKSSENSAIIRNLSGSRLGQSSNRLGSIRVSLMGSRHGHEGQLQCQFDPLFCALQVAKGMTYLHSQDITHRDLKSMNVLLDETYNAKIADFGESIIERSNRHGTGTPQHVETGTAGWAAPETILGKEATKASDVFSFGVVLWELLTWRVPSVMITVETLLEDSVRRHPSTFDHPLLAIVKEQRNPKPNPKKDRKEHSGPVSSSSGFLGAVFSGDTKGGSLKGSGGIRNPIHSGITLNTLHNSTDFSSSPSPEPHTANANAAGKEESGTPHNRRPVGDRIAPSITSSSFHLDERKTAPAADAPRSSEGNKVHDHLGAGGGPGGSAPERRQYPPVLDDDLTMVEISDMRIAQELMCNRHLRPPMPVGIPYGLSLLLQRCWSESPLARPTFPEILSELEKVIIQQRDQFEDSLPCPVDAKVNYAVDAASADVTFV